MVVIFSQKLSNFAIKHMRKRGGPSKMIANYIQEDILCRITRINGFMLITAGLLLCARYYL